MRQLKANRRLSRFVLIMLLIVGLSISIREWSSRLQAQSGTSNLPQALSQHQKLTGDWVGSAFFGDALAAWNKTALIGAPFENHQQGAVYVALRSGHEWNIIQKLTPLPEDNVRLFGTTVAIYQDTAFVSALKATDLGKNLETASIVYVFQRVDQVWTLQQKLKAPNNDKHSGFGAAIALGMNLAFIGAPYEHHDGTVVMSHGAVYVFERNDSTWNLQQALIGSGGRLDGMFGASIALNTNDSLAAIGAYGSHDAENLIPESGAAYVYQRNGDTWSEQQRITVIDSIAYDRFGYATVFSGDTLLISAYGHKDAANKPIGVVYGFKRDLPTWTQIQQIAIPNGTTDSAFGWSMTVDRDQPNTVLIGAIGAHCNGAAYLLTSDMGVWSFSQALASSDGASLDYFGASVAYSQGVALVSAVRNHETQGAVYSFVSDEQPLTQTPTATAVPTEIPPTLTPGQTPTALPGIELLINGSFETDDDLDKLPDNWMSKNLSNDKRKCDTSEKIIAFQGQCVFQFKSSVGENSKLEQVIDPAIFEFLVGDSLTLAGAVYPKGTVNTYVKVRVKYADTALTTGKINAKFKIATAGYLTFTGNTVIVLAALPIQIKLQIGNQGTSGKVLYDAISLKWITAESHLGSRHEPAPK